MLKILRITGLLEGISLLMLFGIAMPMKYAMGEPLMVEIVGMAHGILFIAYVLLVLIVGVSLKWKVFPMLLAIMASVVPFGTFIADKKLFATEAG